MKEHSAAPWTMCRKMAFRNAAQYGKEIVDDNGETVAMIPDWAEHREGNALMVLAGPDMLAACRLFLTIQAEGCFCDTLADDVEMCCMCAGRIAIARAAINKATGGQGDGAT